MRILYILIVFIISSVSLFSQSQSGSFLRYYESVNFMQAPDVAMKFGSYGFTNPAITSYLHDGDNLLSVSTKESDIRKVAILGGSPYGGYGIVYNNYGKYNSIDYRYSLAFGDRNFSYGVGYGFVGGDKAKLGRSNTWQWSFLYRPSNGNVSLSAGQIYSIDKNDYETFAQFALRPIKSYPLAFFADAALYLNYKGSLVDALVKQSTINNGLQYSYGVSWEVVDGFRINARKYSNPYINNTLVKGDFLSVGLDVSFGSSGVQLGGGSTSKENSFVSYNVRFGAKDRVFIDQGLIFKQFVTYDLSGTIKYQNSPYFDDSRTLLSVLQDLDIVLKNDAIKGIVINAVGFSANPSIAWEIREKLREIKKAGKYVYIFIERASLEDYHFASVANRIIMDEMGSVVPSGYALGGSYYKNMLDKLKIGYEELRLFKYKSAAESYARTGFSEGQKEQLQSLVDSWYKTTVSEIAAERPDIDTADVEKFINGQLFYNTKELKEKKFIDYVGRWTDKQAVMDSIKKMDSLKGIYLTPSYFALNKSPEPFDDKWGQYSNKIAVIYAVGICAMEDGINARSLVESVKAAVESPSIRAIVLRVDSPGGDALASEYIAKVIRENKDKKPIIVSQGMLAASGGYWLSMDGDKILASPKTITGSIGVISSWMYDKGASESLGINTDIVQKGKYADLGYSWKLPIIGLGLPTRNLTDDERKQWEGTISTMYDDFITKVAAGRHKDKDSIHQVAQGRVWTGADGLKNGLVDEIGGLDKAIKLAKIEAGLSLDKEIDIIEFPTPKFDFQKFITGLFGFNLKSTVDQVNLLQFKAKNNGLPMPMLPVEFWQYYTAE